ncbi:uncharacterized protein LOC128885603 [Hylaeus anthracinus]|uniref:uncharacterized protein LOC128885603 n=1 Tax=Hylaeus anthracinus TaxID=313031 RepID=UPI0023B9813C|nr:uncharacterized protein LOC128885603 [Hylaeus anthracinus]
MEPSTNEEKQEMQNKPYREFIGGLIYLANATRPDIAYAAALLSRFTSNPGKAHWDCAKRVLRYLNTTSSYKIEYNKDDEKLIAYSDSDWAADIDDRRSCTGNLLILAGGPVSWKSKKQSSVSLSTMEAEYVALSEICREVMFMIRLMDCMDYVETPVTVFCDNQTAIELSKNAMYHKRSKHIGISFHYT